MGIRMIKKLLLLILLLSQPAYAESYAEPLLIGIGTVAIIRHPALNDRCNNEPCNTISHVALGAATSYYVKKRYGVQQALLSGLVIGVGKELADRHFDVKDAMATIIGSVLVIRHEF